MTDIWWKLLPLLAAFAILAGAAKVWKKGERVEAQIGTVIGVAILGLLAASLAYHGYLGSQQEDKDAVELWTRLQRPMNDADRVIAHDVYEAALKKKQVYTLILYGSGTATLCALIFMVVLGAVNVALGPSQQSASGQAAAKK